MAGGKITIRILPDGRVEAEVAGLPGRQCLDHVGLIEKLTGAQTIESRRTAEYFQTAATVQAEAAKLPLKGG